MKKSSRSPKNSAHPKGRARVKDWRIVLLDQEPLRREAASECRRAMARLEEARTEWKRFEREDKPAFGRWMASTFGALLTRIRETVELIRQKETLVHEVEMEMAMGGARSPRMAFAKVQRQRDQSASEPSGNSRETHSQGKDDPFEDSSSSEEEEISDFELELMFEELLGVMGWDPNRMSDKQYAKMFAEFKASVLGKKPPPEPPRNFLPDPTPAKDERSRIKELYRLLVRRLHPDKQVDRDSEVSMLWHEVQEAYNEGNLNRLEMLLALTDIQSNTAGEHTSLFQMRAVLEELRDAFNALRRNISAARKEPAWGFARQANRSSLETRLRCELETELFRHEDRLQQLEILIARWSAPAKRRKGSAWAVKWVSAEFPF